MEHFSVVIQLERLAEGGFTGRILTLSGSETLQDDALDGISVELPGISFHIPAKQTVFEGVFDDALTVLNGEFLFPDGSRHPLMAYRLETTRAEPEPADLLARCLASAYTHEEAREDLYFIYEMLSEHHPDPFRSMSEMEFRGLVEAQAAAIGREVSMGELLRSAARLTDAVACSHTGIRLPGQCQVALAESGRAFPAEVFFQDDRAFIIGAPCSSAWIAEPGTEILSVNGRGIPRIRDMLFTFIPAELGNRSTKLNLLNQQFRQLYFLIDPSEVIEIEFPDTTVRMYTCVGKTAADHPADHTAVRFTFVEAASAAYLRIPTFGIRDMNAYFNRLDEVFQELQDMGADRLILDLRGNQGGHPIFAAQLFSYLTDEPFTYFKRNEDIPDFEPLYNEMKPNDRHFPGRIYVLVNGGCLSTTGHLISLLDHYTDAVFAGEMPGSTNSCYDFSIQLKLPNSGLVLNLPRTVFETAVPASGAAFELTHEVKTSLTDRIENVDTVLEFVIDLIETMK
jgi:hypothetical protein